MIRARWIMAMTAGMACPALGGNVTIDSTLRTGFDNVRLPGPNYQLSESFGKLSANQQNVIISLSAFDIDAGETARFASSLPVRNFITRITGGSASTINGTVISDVPGASLFLINPSGLVIGPTARFEVQGALHLSTAEYLDFSDGARLDTRGGDVPVLSSADPSAFGFLGKGKSINVTGASFGQSIDVTPTDNVFSIVGGDVTLLGASIDAPRGSISVVSSASATAIPVPTLSTFPVTGFMDGSVSIGAMDRGDGTSQQTTLDTRGGGRIAVAGGEVTIRDSQITADTIDRPGAIVIRGGTVRLTDDALVRGDALASADGPTINIRAIQRLIVENKAKVTSQVDVEATGAGGSIGVHTQNLTIRNEGLIQTGTAAATDGASVAVRADGTLLIDGEIPSDIFTAIQTETSLDDPGAGKGGDITIKAGEFIMLREAEVFARTVGAGRAGDLTVTANSLTIDAQDLGFTGLQSRAGTGSTGGNGGTIVVNVANDILLRKGGAISATTFGDGSGGSVIVTARNVYATEVGLGNIDPITREPFNGIFSRSAKTNGTDMVPGDRFTDGGPAGAVTVTAREQVLVAGRSSISAESFSTESGAGDVTVRAPLITVDGAKITVESRNTDGGNVRISGDTVIVVNNAELSAFAAGDGGQMFIRPVDVLVLGNNSTIIAIANGTPVDTQLDPTAAFIKSPDSEIQADNPVVPPELDITGAIVSFNISFTDVARQMQDDCLRRSLENVSTFTVEPRGGLP